MARARRSKGDVAWYIPGRKTPIAYSTKAASDLIALLAQGGGTIREVCGRITYDVEACQVLSAYIRKGYGEVVAQSFFK